jgi:hypothetical protein
MQLAYKQPPFNGISGSVFDAKRAAFCIKAEPESISIAKSLIFSGRFGDG